MLKLLCGILKEKRNIRFSLILLTFSENSVISFFHGICKLSVQIDEQCHEKTCLMSYGNNKTAYQAVQLHSLISAFVVCCLDRVAFSTMYLNCFVCLVYPKLHKSHGAMGEMRET